VFDAPIDPALVDRSLATSRFGSMWLEIPRPQYPPLTGAVSCDLLIVGGGYTGLWSALHAAQRDPAARIVLIEANRIGWAASGRNGGFVDASLTHGGENGRSRWPEEIDTLTAMGLENLDGMQSDIQLDDVRFSHRWAGATDTNTRFCAHWGLAHGGRVGLRQRVHRPRCGSGEIRGRCLSIPAGGWPHAPHTTGDGAQAAVALPARTVCQPRHPGEPEGRRRLRGV
jgi:glycine/D-amino acid oxidase-like deaminating enzyme